MVYSTLDIFTTVVCSRTSNSLSTSGFKGLHTLPADILAAALTRLSRLLQSKVAVKTWISGYLLLYTRITKGNILSYFRVIMYLKISSVKISRVE